MGQPFDVSVNIGFDGSTYYCKRCGKAGYERATQVRGHLALCPGTLMRKREAATTSSNQLQPLATGYSVGACGSQVPLQPVAANPVASPVDTRVQELVAKVAQMENHYNHLLQMNNAPSPDDWFSKNKHVVILVAVVLVAYLLSNTNRQCPTTLSGAGSSSRANVQGIGEKTLTKVMDRAVVKGVDALFKKI